MLLQACDDGDPQKHTAVSPPLKEPCGLEEQFITPTDKCTYQYKNQSGHPLVKALCLPWGDEFRKQRIMLFFVYIIE